MNPGTLIRLALRMIARNKTRAGLTVLGIVIGIAAVIAMVALGQGAERSIAGRIQSLGANLVMVMPGTLVFGGVRGGQGSGATLTLGDVDAITAEVPGVLGAAATARKGAQVVAGDLNWSTSVTGSVPSFYRVREWYAKDGTVHGEADEAGQAKVAVVGQTVARELFGEGDPVGQTIRIQKAPFRVIGVLEAKGQSPFGNDMDDTVIVPFSTFLQRIAGGPRDQVGVAFVAAKDAASVPEVLADVGRLLRQRHHLQEGEDDDFTLRNTQDVAKASAEVAEQMSLLLGAIAAVSLLVGGIGIMNIMLVSVTERTREIGIRMAVGARARDILVQFLVEAVVLSGIGGVIGAGLGWGATQLLESTTGWSTAFDPELALLAVAVSAAVGTVFGIWPARRASLLDPIQALRHE